ncbi:hypothetical protein [Alkalihalobacterium chitinilyticum]|uniref:ABC-2 transporter permease n=1 Tax=Alkalihalobacterium chitinilyticum TaxID=2980103 RepID=A0ABT5VD77_9BACI|nr:hypothetical protein [Alkalihalobacterium chitinilyticum]MDE5413411.1 hypothetical protein [Alkalihalobacterium chitinilyticum]
MNEFKEALWLAKFELKASIQGFLSLLLFLALLLFIIVTASPFIFVEGNVGLDLLFILVFGAFAVYCKPKEFQYQKVEDGLWASPYFMNLLQLPIPKKVLIQSRFIVNFVYTIPFHSFLLLFIYILSPEARQEAPVGTYFVFSLIWICFGIFAAGLFSASDPGDKITIVGMIIWGIVLFVVFIGGLTLFHLFTGMSFVHATLVLASKWPLLTVVISLLLAITSVFYWKSYMSRKIEKMDYFK